MALKFRLITNQAQHITIFVERFDLNQFSSKVADYWRGESAPQGLMMLVENTVDFVLFLVLEQ
jgi:hypothetical protein